MVARTTLRDSRSRPELSSQYVLSKHERGWHEEIAQHIITMGLYSSTRFGSAQHVAAFQIDLNSSLLLSSHNTSGVAQSLVLSYFSNQANQ